MIGYILSTIKCINFIKAYMLHDGSQLQPRPETAAWEIQTRVCVRVSAGLGARPETITQSRSRTPNRNTNSQINTANSSMNTVLQSNL